jgi:cell envelope opacity-associated protein A
MAVLAAEPPDVIATGDSLVPTALGAVVAIEVLKPLTVKSPVRVKTSPLIVVTERDWIVTAVDATIAPVNPAKATTINITHAGTFFRKKLIFSKPPIFCI